MEDPITSKTSAKRTREKTRKAAVTTVAALLFVLSLTLTACDQQTTLDNATDLADRLLSESTTEPRDTTPTPGAVEQNPTAGSTMPEPAPDSAAKLIEGLSVRPETTMAGYDREEFPHWASDAAEFGWQEPVTACDVRDTALIRDGNDVRVDEECRIYAGSWTDPYTTNIYTDPQDLDGDHLVPLAESWRSGASRWTIKERETYANAPGVVLVVDDGANQEKGDKGPEAWLPPNREYWCEYASRWTEIKAVWGMSVDPQEKMALQKIISGCT